MAASRMEFEPRMSDAEALMWHLEKDPALRSSFSNITLFDQPLDFERFRRRMAKAVREVPRLRQRVITPPGRLAAPEWDDDPTFDIDFHVRRIAVAPPGTERQVYDLAALLAEDAFDRARPLWQFVVIDGVEGGRGAMFQKLHHTITDGEGGVRLSALFIDVEREPADAVEAGDADEDSVDAAADGAPVRRARNPLDVARDTVGEIVRRPVGLATRTIGDGIDVVTNPLQTPERVTSALGTARSVLGQLSQTEPARSPLWTTRGLKRRLEVLSVPLDDAKRVAKTLDGTLNDFFVAGAAGGAAAYHRAKGADVDELRMAMPVSTRKSGRSGGNAFSPTRVVVPAGIEDPAARFAAVRDRLSVTKSDPAVSAYAGLAGLLNLLPTSVLVRVARQQVQTIDFATSNVRGAPFDLYMAGAKVLANYPMGPTGGTAFNLTLLSYGGRLDMGCNIDTAAVADPELLRRCLVEAFDELLAAAG